MAQVLKSLAGRFGPYSVWFVDETEVRGLSREAEEFTNYGVADDIPGVIPGDEVWLSSRVPEGERAVLVEEALTRLRLEAAGVGAVRAYRLALRRSRAERARAAHGAPGDASAVPAVYRSVPELVEASDGPLRVYTVDGEAVRDRFLLDFVEGGHGLVYPAFIPRHEVWIDEEVPERERPLIRLHELTERELMLRGTPYAEAHRRASEVEWRARAGG